MLNHESADGWSLRKLLQSSKHYQVWWDPRGDQDALFHHLGIILPSNNVLNLALIAIAVHGWERSRPVTHRMSLADCIGIEGTAWMSEKAVKAWGLANSSAKQFLRESDYRCFHERPLSTRAWEYAAGDVDHLIRLYDLLAPKLTLSMEQVVNRVTVRELNEAMAANKPFSSAEAPDDFSVLPVRVSPPSKPYVFDPSHWEKAPKPDSDTERDNDLDEGWKIMAKRQGPDHWEAAHLAANGFGAGRGRARRLQRF